MNIHEYQAKSLLDRYNVLTPGGRVASSPEEAKACALALGGQRWAVKAQIHAGGRGAGRFNPDHDGQGGVRLASSPEDVEAAAQAMLGRILVTRQTGPEGRRVNRVYVERSCHSVRECYLCVFIDRSTRCVTIMASSEGGMDIEELATKRPELIQRVMIDPTMGLQSFHARKLAYGLGFEGKIAQSATRLIEGAVCTFLESEASIVEINPLAIVEADEVMALDAKIVIDDNGLFRHSDIAKLHDKDEEDPAEFEAASHHLSYVKLNGQVGCMVNGAGLAMATMDIIRHYGAVYDVAPANFLDVGGSATAERVAAAFKIILKDVNVRGILVNIFGGIMRCDVVAEGIVSAAREVRLDIPLVVRLEGTNVELGKKILSQSGLVIQAADTLADAAQMIVAAVRGGH